MVRGIFFFISLGNLIIRSQVFSMTSKFAITLPKHSADSRSKRVHNLSKQIVLGEVEGELQGSYDAV